MSHTRYEPATPRLQRSTLAVPGSNPAMLRKALESEAINGENGSSGRWNYSAAKAASAGSPWQVRNKITAEIPIGRMGTPEEVAYVVDFLASSEAALFTGANLSCNGGQHMM